MAQTQQQHEKENEAIAAIKKANEEASEKDWPPVTELGPLQKEWVARLRANPQRQTCAVLGEKDLGTEEYKACCLGEAGLMLGTVEWTHDNPDGAHFKDRLFLRNNVGDSYASLLHRTQLGLLSSLGDLWKPVYKNTKRFDSLANMNDGGYTWPEIADYIETNPTNVFFKSI